MTIGEQLREIRDSLNLTQTQIFSSRKWKK